MFIMDEDQILDNSDLTTAPDFWPFTLMNKVFGDSTAYIHANIPGIYEMVNTLTSMEKKVILMRCRDRLTLEKTGLQFGYTRERVRQIEAKALRKLRHPSRSKKMLAVSKADMEEVKEQVFHLETEIRISKMTNDGTLSIGDDISIESLDFSVRTYNCLKRAGISTVSDLIRKSVDDLMKVRNLGRKGFQEVVDKMASINLPLQGTMQLEEGGD